MNKLKYLNVKMNCYKSKEILTGEQRTGPLRKFDKCKLVEIYGNKYAEQIIWSVTPHENGLTYAVGDYTGIDMKIGEQRRLAEKNEKCWGNQMIGKYEEGKLNGNWTTKLGERLVNEVLVKLNENPKRPEIRDGFQPDIETDKRIIEVKTKSWTVSGTANEKILGTWLKYQNIPELYNKPLSIVCIGHAEWELTYGKTKFFGDEVSNKTKEALRLAKIWGIEYVRFSDLVYSSINSVH